MIKILVTGSNGQVGSELRAMADSFPDYEFYFTDRSNLDIGNATQVLAVAEDFKPHFLINCAAYTAVDLAEDEEEIAYAINVQAVQHLAKACKQNGCWMLHLSSDYVYHIESETPMVESSDKMPLGVYARTKLKADLLLEESGIDYTIIRTSWVYSSMGKNFVKTMLRLGKSNETLKVVEDQWGSPTYAKDIAEVLCSCVQQIHESKLNSQQEKMRGVFNFSNDGKTNWAEFAATIFDLQGIQCKIMGISTEEFGAKAPRPSWSVLDKSKIIDTFNIQLKSWKSSLRDCLALIDEL